jgi:hypothetical protein
MNNISFENIKDKQKLIMLKSYLSGTKCIIGLNKNKKEIDSSLGQGAAGIGLAVASFFSGGLAGSAALSTSKAAIVSSNIARGVVLTGDIFWASYSTTNTVKECKKHFNKLEKVKAPKLKNNNQCTQYSDSWYQLYEDRKSCYFDIALSTIDFLPFVPYMRTNIPREMRQSLQQSSHHITSQSLKSEIKSPNSILNKIMNVLAKSQAENLSLSHQDDVIQAVNNPKLKKSLSKLGFDFKAYVKGVIQSDKGKLKAYKDLLTNQSAKSDLLLNVLKGDKNSKSAKALKELLEQSGLKPPHLLNPSLTNKELREIFKENPKLINFLHELPGISDAIMAFEAGKISKKEFLNQIKVNLFHNGPNEGFWKFFSQNLIPQDLAKGSRKTKRFFENTVFAGKKNADGVIVPQYRSPISLEGNVHLLFDRVSQASQGGILKIFEELAQTVKANPIVHMKTVLTDNLNGTLKQLDAIKDQASKTLSDKEYNLFYDLVKQAKNRIKQNQRYLAKNIKFNDLGGGVNNMVVKMPFNSPYSEIRIFKSGNNNTRVTYMPKKKGTKMLTRGYSNPDEANKFVSETIQEVLKREEALNGNPMTTIQ